MDASDILPDITFADVRQKFREVVQHGHPTRHDTSFASSVVKKSHGMLGRRQPRFLEVRHDPSSGRTFLDLFAIPARTDVQKPKTVLCFMPYTSIEQSFDVDTARRVTISRLCKVRSDGKECSTGCADRGNDQESEPYQLELEFPSKELASLFATLVHRRVEYSIARFANCAKKSVAASGSACQDARCETCSWRWHAFNNVALCLPSILYMADSGACAKPNSVVCRKFHLANEDVPLLSLQVTVHPVLQTMARQVGIRGFCSPESGARESAQFVLKLVEKAQETYSRSRFLHVNTFDNIGWASSCTEPAALSIYTHMHNDENHVCIVYALCAGAKGGNVVVEVETHHPDLQLAVRMAWSFVPILRSIAESIVFS